MDTLVDRILVDSEKRHHNPQCTREEAEAHGREVTCPSSPCQGEAERGSELQAQCLHTWGSGAHMSRVGAGCGLLKGEDCVVPGGTGAHSWDCALWPRTKHPATPGICPVLSVTPGLPGAREGLHRCGCGLRLWPSSRLSPSSSAASPHLRQPEAEAGEAQGPALVASDQRSSRG